MGDGPKVRESWVTSGILDAGDVFGRELIEQELERLHAIADRLQDAGRDLGQAAGEHLLLALDAQRRGDMAGASFHMDEVGKLEKEERRLSGQYAGVQRSIARWSSFLRAGSSSSPQKVGAAGTQTSGGSASDTSLATVSDGGVGSPYNSAAGASGSGSTTRTPRAGSYTFPGGEGTWEAPSTPNPADDSLSLSGNPISAVVDIRAFAAASRGVRVRSPRSDEPLEDTSLASADVDWRMIGFDPTVDPTPYAGAVLAGGMGAAAIRDGYGGAVSATNGGGGSSGLRPSAVGVGGGPILAFRPDMDSPTDRGKVDEATMLVDRFTTIPGSSGDVPGGGGDPAAMRSSTPAVGGSGSTIGGMARLGAAMVSIDRGVGKVQPGAVAGTYRRR